MSTLWKAFLKDGQNTCLQYSIDLAEDQLRENKILFERNKKIITIYNCTLSKEHLQVLFQLNHFGVWYPSVLKTSTKGKFYIKFKKRTKDEAVLASTNTVPF